MPANLDITNGVASFVAARNPGWHDLGETLPKDGLTAEEVMTHGRLGGWDVRLVPLFAQTEFGRIEVPGKRAVVRNNPVIPGQIDVMNGIVSEGFGVIQNEEHAALLNALVNESGAVFDTAGALDANGERVFISMKLPGHIKVGGQDLHDVHITALNGHTGNLKFTFLVTPIRVVCGNTWNMALRNHVASFGVRHTSGAKAAIVAQAREVMGITFDYLDEMQEVSEKLAGTTMTNRRFEEIIVKEFGAPEDAGQAAKTRADRRLEEMMTLFTDEFTQDGIRETAWAGLNALTEWHDWMAPARGDDPDGTRARRALVDDKWKTKALDLMLAEVPA